MRLRNLTTGKIVAANVVRGDTSWVRLRGFLFRDAVSPDEGIWFPNCSVIHMVGMRVPLDVIFLDEHGCVVNLRPQVARGRLVVGCRKAHSVVELGAGALERSDVLIGDCLSLEDR